MLLSVFGTPSAIGYSGCALIRALADCVFGAHHFISSIFVEDLKNGWANVDLSVTKSVVLFSDLPSKALIDLLVANNAPTTIFVDDFATIAAQVMSARNVSGTDAARLATQVVCSLDLMEGAYVIYVTPRDFERNLGEVLLDLCDFYSIPQAELVAERVLVKLNANQHVKFGDFVRGQKLVLHPHQFDDDSKAFENVRWLARQYAGIGKQRQKSDISWPVSLFLNADRPGQHLTEHIELTGPARYLIYGPYLHIPAGDWIVMIKIETAENCSGNRLLADVFSGRVLGGITTRLPSNGLFGFEIHCRIHDPFLPIEVRLQTLEGSIEGRLWVRDVTFRPREQ